MVFLFDGLSFRFSQGSPADKIHRNVAKSPSVASSPTSGTFPTKRSSPAPPQRGNARGPRTSQQSTMAEVNRRRAVSRTRVGPTGNMASDSRNPTSSRAVETRRSPTEPMEGVVASEKQQVASATMENDAPMPQVQPTSGSHLKREEMEPTEGHAERPKNTQRSLEHSPNQMGGDTEKKASAHVSESRSRRGSRSSKPDTTLNSLAAQEAGRESRNVLGGNGGNDVDPAPVSVGPIPPGGASSPTKGIFGTGPGDGPQPVATRRKSTNGTNGKDSNSRTPDTAQQPKPVSRSASPTENQDGHQASTAIRDAIRDPTGPRSIVETTMSTSMEALPVTTATATARRSSNSVKQPGAILSGPAASPTLPATSRSRKPSQSRNPPPASSSPPLSSGRGTREDAGPAEPEIEEVEEDSEGSENEPKYCHCGQVSYGQMIGCDNDRCPREWFHLACVKMEKVPSSKTKWFCSRACREQARGLKTEEARGGSSGDR